MSAVRDRVQAYFERQEKERLQREAAARGVSVSQCATDCLREYFAWREEMAAAVDSPGQPGEAHRGGPIQSLLARTESRLAATLDARVRELAGEMVLLQSMIDRQAVSYFLHTPEVPPELQDGAVASATRRYRNWRSAVERLVRSGGVNGEAAAQLSAEGGSEA
jgi:predicted transcriptional regulator